MSHWLKTLAVAALPAAALSGCVDDNYDLSDVDTTTRITVNDLVVPVNIDEIRLSDIIAPDADSKIKVVTIDGKEFYALSETGSFGSDAIRVDNITAAAPVLNPTVETLTLHSGMRADYDGTSTYGIEPMGNDFSYRDDDVDEAIVEVFSVRTKPVTFNIHLTAKDVDAVAERIAFSDLVISVPKGLTAEASEGVYDAATGLWTIAEHEVAGTESDISLTATAIDLMANGSGIAADHSLTLSGAFRVESGLLTIVAKRDAQGVPVQLPASLEFAADYTLSDLEVTAFAGTIEYTLEGMDIAPVDITDIPDFLSDPATNLLIDNPQLYLQLNNPVADNGLGYRAGIELRALREDAPTLDFVPDGPIEVGFEHGVAGPYNIVLAPSQDALTTPEAFKANLGYVAFPTLDGLLGSAEGGAAAGLPKQIGVSIVSPCIPRQSVSDFALGTDIPGVEGSYELLAPLALKEGSVIVYSEKETGWSSEDLDAVTITRLECRVDVTNSIPLNASLVAYPLDKDGRRMQGVEVKAQEVKAGCTDAPLTIEMTGEVRYLDGIEFVATVHGAGVETLAPSQTISLKNIRACVSGWYEKEL